MPTVSIIIPNYNHAPYLKQRIDSVLQQTYQDFEVIILDDLSTDNSREIIEEYRNISKVSQIVYNTENSGSTFKQWEKGINLAQGDWIWIAESDDTADINFLTTLLKNSEFEKNAGLRYAASYLIDENSEIITDTWKTFDMGIRKWDENFENDGKKYVTELLYQRNYIPNASAVIFRKKAVTPTVFNEVSTMKFAGDWLFWAKLLENSDVSYCAQRLNYCRIHQHTTRTVKSAVLEKKRFEEYFQVLHYINKKYQLTWNFSKHLWIISEWNERFDLVNGSAYNFFNKSFPAEYNIRLFKNKLKNRYWKLRQKIKVAYKNYTQNAIKVPLPPKTCRLIETPNNDKTLFENNIPKIIWTYWDDEKIPEFVNNCVQTFTLQNTDYQVFVLNKITVEQYLGTLPIELEFSLIHKTDFIRLALLSKFGGIYIDAATVLTESVDWILNLQMKHQVEFVGFYNPTFMNSEIPFVESWFLASVKNSKFMNDWFEEFKKPIFSGNFKDYYKTDPNYAVLKQNLPEGFEGYLIIHLSAQKILSKENYNILAIDCLDEALFYRYATSPAEDGAQYADFLLAAKSPKEISKIIKFTGGDRKAINNYLKLYKVNSNSILNKLKIV
ncbi:glycosyltransferase [Chryseobacterium sp.]|uniref:glycosyltransferase n=1 Tax=Chryseobacterium sp. TaxID=1871047 RepID=UPI0028A19FF3|nr:glycosyltransferase [Chryseobacterium sp.]